MRSFCFVSIAVATVSGVAFENDEGLSLLQRHKLRQHSNVSQNPGQRESQMCPHEIEELKQKKKLEGAPFGCRGKLFAPSTKKCSMWGEPHVSSSFPSQTGFNGQTQFDVFMKPGHFRMAKAKDNSWEIQVFNCGRYASAFAGRFGKDIIEFIASHSGPQRYVNGKLQTGDFPVELPSGVWMDDKHKHVESNTLHANRHQQIGACVDDGNSGQVYFEIGANPFEQNLNVMIRVADGTMTTNDEDPSSFCNKDLQNYFSRGWRGTGDPTAKETLDSWDLQEVTPAENIFTVGGKMCELCSKPDWIKSHPPPGGWPFDHESCTLPPMEKELLMPRGECQERGIDWNAALDACAHVKDDAEFYFDCQLDFCVSNGDVAAAADAEDEQALEHPEPKCVKEGGDCDPVKVCCDAKKDKKTLNLGNVATNNLCGDGDGKQELRFTSVLSGVDLVVKPTGDFKCTQGVTNAKNGVDGQFGVITLPVGTEAEFEFTYVNAGTDSPKDVGAQPFSFLDIDQGKKGKQRSSVEVCGGANAILTTNTELEQSNSGNCIKVTSSTRGTGADNPKDPDNMSDIQRARTVAFTPSGSTFKATLGISSKGKMSRKFMFSGGPTIACDAL